MSRRTQIMAILNITPDSFSDGGQWQNLDETLKAAEVAIEAGAGILDIGGESTRPGAAEISVDSELQRVLPVIEGIRQRFPECCISIDTRKAKVAEQAVQAGASIINDVSGLQFDEAMAETVAKTGARLVLMHSQGIPESMQNNPVYQRGAVEEVTSFFARQTRFAESAGISKERIILDPGFGFGKTIQHNLSLLKRLAQFQRFGYPLLVGTSRKSFLTLGDSKILPAQREALTAASLMFAIDHGATYVRLHDIVTQAPVVRFIDALRQAE